MNTRDASPGDPRRVPAPPEPAFVGPICLGIVPVWLLTVALWIIVPDRSVPESVATQFTQTGRKYFRPEFDLHIYLAGLALAVLAGLGAAVAWRRRWQSSTSAAARARIERRAGRHFWWVLLSVAVACLAPLNEVLQLLAAGIAVCAGVVLWAGSKSRGATRTAVPAATKPPLPATPATGAQGGSAAVGVTHNCIFDPPGSDPETSRYPADSRRTRWVTAALAAIVIAMTVFVPDPAALEARAWKLDGLMHWNFYLMGPLLAFRHGAALGTEFYSQYSVGWPLLFAGLGSAFSTDYRLIFEAVTLLGCVYFLMLYFFLRSLTGRSAWALAGLLVALFLQMFSGTAGPLWMYPSSTILRNPLDVPLFWLCLHHARSGHSQTGIGIGCVAGLAVLFGTDTGIYAAAALLFYCGLCSRYRPAGRSLLNVAFVTKAGIAFLVTVIAGLSWASRGTLLQQKFWLGYWEPLLFYSGGISALPMREGLAAREDFLLFVAALLAYSFAIAFALFRWLTRRLEAADLVLALVAAFGLETMMIFINRSHPFNLYHPIIPFCILAVAFAARCAPLLRRTASTDVVARRLARFRPDAVPWAVIAVVVVAFAFNPHLRDYPSLLARLAPQSHTPPTIASGRGESEDYRDDLRPFAEILRNLSEEGRYSLGLVDPGDTNLLALADMRPWFRYSPVDPLHHRQVALIEQTLDTNPPDIVLFSVYSASEMAELRRELLQKGYSADGRAGPWLVVRRSPP